MSFRETIAYSQDAYNPIAVQLIVWDLQMLQKIRLAAHRGSHRLRFIDLSLDYVNTAVRRHLLVSIGAFLGISLTGLICAIALGRDAHLPLIVAPMGASAVLLFAVPTSPFAQPWSIIGGNTISSLVGILVRQHIHEPMVATGLAVGLALFVMSIARCLHPPGGAAALTTIIGGPSVTAAGFAFALVPICINAVLLVLLGAAFHKLSGNSYPHTPRTGDIRSNLLQHRDLKQPGTMGSSAAS